MAWEYPPYKVGGLGTHIEELAQAQAQKGITPIVIACSFEGKTGKTTENGVTVYRFDSDHLPAEDFPSWALEMNILMYNQAAAAIAEEGGVDVIHAHDWIVS
ncbi:MAG: glycogen/starch synthase, partial [Candidatus Aenigmarchaeota archaeon]|nr:glycogen/starch synthase [Candidatus Aenigmarchaeota archaeon]